MKSRPLEEGRVLPLVIEPAVEEVDLVEWARQNRSFVDDRLVEHGALLFRGFGEDVVERFEAFADAVCDGLFNENGEHPRESVSGNVYTPVFYPPDERLLPHNENSFNHRWPKKILFCCAQPPEQGGETPITDSREVYRKLDDALRSTFEERGVMYMRNYYQGGVGLSWREVFQTADPAEVERRCREDGIRFEWKNDEELRTRTVQPGVIVHPDSGEKVWFNQAQHWHVACLNPETRASISKLFADEDLPRHCYFGDGSPIDDESMEHILSVYDELEVSFPWRRGDILLVDNVLAAHGRNPFSGERKILVAMGEMTSYDDVEAGDRRGGER